MVEIEHAFAVITKWGAVLKLKSMHDSGLRTQDRFIQHKITLGNITSGLHCKTILAC